MNKLYDLVNITREEQDAYRDYIFNKKNRDKAVFLEAQHEDCEKRQKHEVYRIHRKGNDEFVYVGFQNNYVVDIEPVPPDMIEEVKKNLSKFKVIYGIREYEEEKEIGPSRDR